MRPSASLTVTMSIAWLTRDRSQLSLSTSRASASFGLAMSRAIVETKSIAPVSSRWSLDANPRDGVGRDILERGDRARNTAKTVIERGRRDAHVANVSIGPHDPVLTARHTSLGQCLPHLVEDAGPIVGMDQAWTEHLVGRDAEDLPEPGVGVDHFVVRARVQDAQ